MEPWEGTWAIYPRRSQGPGTACRPPLSPSLPSSLSLQLTHLGKTLPTIVQTPLRALHGQDRSPPRLGPSRLANADKLGYPYQVQRHCAWGGDTDTRRTPFIQDSQEKKIPKKNTCAGNRNHHITNKPEANKPT